MDAKTLDYDLLLRMMLALPSACHIQQTPTLRIEKSRVKADTTGHAAYWSKTDRGHIAMRIGYDSTPHRTVGVLLHEVAHHAVRTLHGLEAAHDSSRIFARICHNLHDEWNSRHQDICEVSILLTGAYVGKEKVRDYAASPVPARMGKPDPMAGHIRITGDNVWEMDLWAKAQARHTGPVTVAIPGTLATEISFRYTDGADESDDADRQIFAKWWQNAKTVKRGRGTQTIVTLPAGQLYQLRNAFNDAVWDYGDCPVSQSQSIRVLDQLLNS